MANDWRGEWKRTPKGARIMLVVLSIVIVIASVGAGIYNIQIHDYANAAGFPLPIIWLGGRFVLWPWRLAWAACKRGGRFDRWMAGAFFGGFLIAGPVYLFTRGKKPLLREFQETQAEPADA